MSKTAQSAVKKKILFVCMGNICRSPSAEGVFRHLVQQRGLAEQFEIDSAGTHAYHVGEPPDARASKAAGRRGITLAGQQARKVQVEDFDHFDLVLAMDASNLQDLQRICPSAHRHKLKRMLEFGSAGGDVPDPYYGGADGFEHVLDLLEDACTALLNEMEGERTHG